MFGTDDALAPPPLSSPSSCSWSSNWWFNSISKQDLEKLLLECKLFDVTIYRTLLKFVCYNHFCFLPKTIFPFIFFFFNTTSIQRLSKEVLDFLHLPDLNCGNTVVLGKDFPDPKRLQRALCPDIGPIGSTISVAATNWGYQETTKWGPLRPQDVGRWLGVTDPWNAR